MDRARFESARQGEEGVSPPLPVAKWCREGRWIDGKLYNSRDEIIFDNTTRTCQNRAGTAQSMKWVEMIVFGAKCVVAVPTYQGHEIHDHGPLGPNA